MHVFNSSADGKLGESEMFHALKNKCDQNLFNREFKFVLITYTDCRREHHWTN